VPHIDLYPVPGEERSVVYTTGIAAYPMQGVPKGREYAELMAVLPPGWPLAYEDMRERANWWPLGMLLRVARLPYSEDYPLLPFYSMPWTHDGSPVEGTDWVGCMFVPADEWTEGLGQVAMPGGHTVHMLLMVPLRADEVGWKARQPEPDALWRRATAGGLSPASLVAFDPSRPSMLA
jgi:hypothetical protein